jgi:arylsulfatase
LVKYQPYACTRIKPESRYLALHTTEHDMYGSGMMEHDMQVGMILAELEKWEN